MILSQKEANIFKRLNTPQKIQNFLDSLSINFEEKEETCSSPRIVLRRRSAHCIEAALLAAAILKFHKQKAFLMDLKANNHDFDHVVCLFKDKKYWGAISKSNHAALRYREPVYRTVRELAMSYFHEYINSKGQKTLRSYSVPHGLDRYGSKWITAEDNLWQIANQVDEIKHHKILPRNLSLRKADKFEAYISNIAEWGNTGKRKMLKYK